MKKLLISLLMISSTELYADDLIILDSYPSANMYGMFRTGASRISDDTYSNFANPALSSLTSTPNMISFNFGTGLIMHYYDHNSYNYAISLNQKKGKWSYGLGIFHQTLDMGDIYDSKIIDGNLVEIKKGEYPNNYQTGLNLSSTFGSTFQIGFGLNLKYIYTEDDNNPNPNSGSFVTDLGMIASYHILENKKITDKMGIDLLLSAGISKTNILIDNKRSVNSDDRIGYSIQTGLNYSLEKNDIKLISLNWTAEVVSPNENKEYFDNISVFKNVILLDGINSIGAYKINLLETIVFMKSIENKIFSTEFNSFGVGLSTAGITKIINEYSDNKVIKWLNENLVLDYTFAKITTTFQIYENNNNFHSIQLSYKNFNLFGK